MRRLLLVGLLMVLAACSTSSPSATLPSVVGTWSAQSGGEVLGGLSTSGVSLKFLDLAADGTGKVYGTQTDSNVLVCVPVVYAVVSQNVLSLATTANGVSEFSVELYPFQRGDTSLSIRSKDGVSQTLTKASAVAASSQCETGNVTSKLENLAITSNSWGNLINDGTNLKLVDRNNVLNTINPVTGALSSPQPVPGGFSYFVTTQGTDYWGTCACGNVNDIKRHGPAPTFTQSTTINTNTDLANEITIYTGGFDGTSLWLGGSSRASGSFRFLQVNPVSKTLLSSFDFKTSLRHVAFSGSQLWGLVNLLGSKLVLIDTVTHKAVRTLNLPAPSTGSYYGLTAMGGKLYVLQQNGNSTSSIVVVQP